MTKEAERETVKPVAWFVAFEGDLEHAGVYFSEESAAYERDNWDRKMEVVPVVTQSAFAAERERADELQRQLAEAQKDVRKWKASFDAQSSDYQRLANEVGDKDDAIERLGDIGRLVGCDHHDYSDGRLQLVNCVEQAIDGLERQIEALTARAEQAEADCAAILKVFGEVIDWQGIDHEDEDCPEDDTCECEIVARVNAVFNPNPGAAILAKRDKLRAILREAISLYGKPGGPWNVPSEPGSWLARAREALGEGPATNRKRATINWRPGPAKGGKDSPADGDQILCAFDCQSSGRKWWKYEVLYFVVDDDATEAIACLDTADGDASDEDWDSVAYWLPVSELLPKAEGKVE